MFVEIGIAQAAEHENEPAARATQALEHGHGTHCAEGAPLPEPQLPSCRPLRERVAPQPVPALENVGCETCHGRGGPHLSPHFVENHDYSKVCVTCHDPKHSIGFDYATFVKRISHRDNARFAHLSLAEKKKLLEDVEVPGTAEPEP